MKTSLCRPVGEHGPTGGTFPGRDLGSEGCCEHVGTWPAGFHSACGWDSDFQLLSVLAQRAPVFLSCWGDGSPWRSYAQPSSPLDPREGGLKGRAAKGILSLWRVTCLCPQVKELQYHCTIRDAWSGMRHVVQLRAREEFGHGLWSEWSQEVLGTPWTGRCWWARKGCFSVAAVSVTCCYITSHSQTRGKTNHLSAQDFGNESARQRSCWSCLRQYMRLRQVCRTLGGLTHMPDGWYRHMAGVLGSSLKPGPF